MQSSEMIMKKTERWPARLLGQQGFTAFEILIVVAVSVILIGVSIPFFGGVMQTYRLNGATRHIVSEIRMTQSLAVSRGGVYGFHWGGDPDPAVTKLNSEYRLEQRGPGGACADWPDQNQTLANPLVITRWTDLSDDYSNITVLSIVDNGAPFPQSVGGVMFNSRGAAFNDCPGAHPFPLTIRVSNVATGGQRCIQTRSAGSVRILDACP